MLRFTVPLLTILAIPALASPEIELGWPVACEIGVTCEIQHYVDHGTDTAAQDHRCGTVTYKGHNGTDIRVPTTVAERAGVDVIAAAPGRVLRVRDDMVDVSTRVTGRKAVQGRECGNGLVIAHANGVETQYCHLAQGSVVVKAGDTVSVGQKLGRVGLSGDSEFPHLHFTVRRDGKVVDPFASDLPAGTCGGGVPLWQPRLLASLQYKAGAVLNAGFAPSQVTMEDIENGAGKEALTANSPAIVAFVRAITLRKGDVQRIVLRGPEGLLADHSAPPLADNKAQVFLEVGRRKPAAGWPLGSYTATYTVTRDGKAEITKTFTASVQP